MAAETAEDLDVPSVQHLQALTDKPEPIAAAPVAQQATRAPPPSFMRTSNI